MYLPFGPMDVGCAAIARGVAGAATVIALLAPGPVLAQDPPKKPLALTASVSFVDAAGNTDVTTLSGDQRLEYAPAGSGWTLSEFVALVYGRTDGVTSANALKLGGRADRAFTDRLSVFGGGSYERNRFAGIARRFEEIAGLAYRLVNAPRDQLSAELGAIVQPAAKHRRDGRRVRRRSRRGHVSAPVHRARLGPAAGGVPAQPRNRGRPPDQRRNLAGGAALGAVRRESRLHHPLRQPA